MRLDDLDIPKRSNPRHLRMFPATTPIELGKPHSRWELPDGASWCDIHKIEHGYRMRFPEMADFTVSHDGAVTCYPVPGTDRYTLEHLHQNQVIPAALSMLHHGVFHAGAVVAEQGALALVGVSGRGKSTLATYLAMHGFPLLSDDGLELDLNGTNAYVQPAHPSVRLWQDSRKALLPAHAQRAPALPYTVKERFRDPGLLPHASEPQVLRAAYFLGTGSALSVRIEPMPAHEAHMAWVKHAFLMDPHDQGRMRSLFEQVAKLVGMGVSYRLDYPRRYDILPAVREALLAHNGTPAGPD